MNCPTCSTPITGIMIVTDLTPRPELAPNADRRGVKCQHPDFIHFHATFAVHGRELRVERLAILDGSPTHERLAQAKIDAGLVKVEEPKVKKKRRKTPAWLTNIDES